MSGFEDLQVKKMDLSSQTDEKVKEDVKKDNCSVPKWWFLVVGGVITALFTWYAQRNSKYINCNICYCAALSVKVERLCFYIYVNFNLVLFELICKY